MRQIGMPDQHITCPGEKGGSSVSEALGIALNTSQKTLVLFRVAFDPLVGATRQKRRRPMPTGPRQSLAKRSAWVAKRRKNHRLIVRASDPP